MVKSGNQGNLPNELEWDFNIPAWDRFILQSLTRVLVLANIVIITLVFVPSIVFLSDFLLKYAGYILAMVLVVIFFVELVVLLIIPRIYRRVRFRVEERGAGFITLSKLRPFFKAFGLLLIPLGLVQEGLVSEGIGLRSSQTCGTGIGSFIRWQDVREVLLYPEKHVIVLKERWITGGLGGGLRSLSLYCTPENYGTVAAMVLGYTKERAESKIKIVG